MSDRILIIDCCYDCKYIKFRHDPKPFCGYVKFDSEMIAVMYKNRVIGSFKTSIPSWCQLEKKGEMMNSRIAICKYCEQDYCMECSEHEKWEEFCSDDCYNDYQGERKPPFSPSDNPACNE